MKGNTAKGNTAIELVVLVALITVIATVLGEYGKTELEVWLKHRTEVKK